MVDEPVGEAAGVSVRRPGGAVDRRNAASLTPLHVAAQQCCDEAVSLLLSSGAVAGAPARTGHTPLHACCAARAPPPRARVTCVRLLLAAGADPCAALDDGTTPLHVLAAVGDAECAVVLLAAGGRNEPDKRGDTPLHLAATHGRIDVMKALVLWGHSASPTAGSPASPEAAPPQDDTRAATHWRSLEDSFAMTVASRADGAQRGPARQVLNDGPAAALDADHAGRDDAAPEAAEHIPQRRSSGGDASPKESRGAAAGGSDKRASSSLPGAARPPGSGADDWVCYATADGDAYWYSASTDESQWSPPKPRAPPAAPPEAPSCTPPPRQWFPQLARDEAAPDACVGAGGAPPLSEGPCARSDDAFSDPRAPLDDGGDGRPRARDAWGGHPADDDAHDDGDQSRSTNQWGTQWGGVPGEASRSSPHDHDAGGPGPSETPRDDGDGDDDDDDRRRGDGPHASGAVRRVASQLEKDAPSRSESSSRQHHAAPYDAERAPPRGAAPAWVELEVREVLEDGSDTSSRRPQRGGAQTGAGAETVDHVLHFSSSEDEAATASRRRAGIEDDDDSGARRDRLERRLDSGVAEAAAVDGGVSPRAGAGPAARDGTRATSEGDDASEASATTVTDRHLAIWSTFLMNAAKRSIELPDGETAAEVAQRRAREANADLRAAAAANDTVVAAELLDSGVSPNRGDADARMPAHFAAYANALAVARLLYDCGADIDARDAGGNQPLHVAAARGSHAVLAFLVGCAAPVNDANDDGDRPLHLAAWMGFPDCVRALLDAGASIDAMNEFGFDALENVRSRSPVFAKQAARRRAGKKPKRLPEGLAAAMALLEAAVEDRRRLEADAGGGDDEDDDDGGDGDAV